ncbi:unnamed protein product [Penicillium egyptiacum]|uniref:Uncharacterized protein n=1 Tax=Penicillium egyptiacum TaxID=1303716 RepID=A0A9W4P588_9EURO|nr:unnamed protein product [Penicillium egyptiacum]
MTSVEACLDSNNTPHCSLNVNVGADSGDLYWGADNCLYNEGATTKYGCATPAN